MYPLKIKEKYDQNNLGSLGHRFTVVYLGNYKDGDYKEFNGSHPGVDIVPEIKNQDVFSVLDGKVFKTGEDGAYGKFVVIEHLGVPDPNDLTKTTTLYSCYEHLSQVNVSIGDIVKEGDIIGKTGNTGNSFGEHLHFQIDRMEAPFHPYWPFTGSEVKAIGVSFSEGVNIGLGLDKAKMYTVNPLVYLDKLSDTSYKTTITSEMRENFDAKLQPVTSSSTPILTGSITSNDIPILSSNIASSSDEIAINPGTLVEDVNSESALEKNDNHTLNTKKSSESIVSNDSLTENSKPNLSSSKPFEYDKKKFKDIDVSDPYYDYILELFLKGYLNGYPDGTFRPKNKVTRIEMLKLLLLASKTTLSTDSKDYFFDIPSGSWQKKYVNTAVNLKLVSTKNKNFNPNSFVTLVEALKMGIKLFVGEIDNVYSQKLADVSGNEWYAKYVEYAIKKDLVTVTGKHFYPNKNITRYETVVLLYKLSKLKNP